MRIRLQASGFGVLPGPDGVTPVLLRDRPRREDQGREGQKCLRALTPGTWRPSQTRQPPVSALPSPFASLASPEFGRLAKDALDHHAGCVIATSRMLGCSGYV